MSVEFKVVAFTPDDFERTVYVASDRQIHLSTTGMVERMSVTAGGGGLVLDPADYPPGTKFLLVWRGK